MAVNRRIDAVLARLPLKRREENDRHHTYNEDMGQYEYVKRGDVQARTAMLDKGWQGIRSRPPRPRALRQGPLGPWTHPGESAQTQ